MTNLRTVCVIFLAGYAGQKNRQFQLHLATQHMRIMLFNLITMLLIPTLRSNLKKIFFWQYLKIIYRYIIIFSRYIFFKILFKILISSEWNIHKFYTKFTKSSEHFFQKVPKISSKKFLTPSFHADLKKIHANKLTMSINIPDSKRLTWQIFGNFP